jgi:glycosyltransferase involved in cell wall biosynthesis
VFVEGKVGRFEALARVAPLNFALAQRELLTQLTRIVREYGVSVVRAGDPLLMGLYGWCLARRCGIPFVVRVNANYERLRRETGRPVMPRCFRTPRIERAVERFVLARAALVAAVNDDNLRYALSMGARADRATVFRYGNLVAPVHFTPPQLRESGRPLLASLGVPERPFLLCVGRLERAKMPDHPVRALAIVRSHGFDALLVMVGGGSMLAELRTLAKELGVAAHVVFTGERDQEWLSRVIPHAAAVLSPLTGRALSEVALGGAPTIAYDVDWQGELIRAGETGELVPAYDVEAMARAACRFLADAAYARRMGGALRAAARETMDPERLDAHERSQYARLLEGWGPGRS